MNETYWYATTAGGTEAAHALGEQWAARGGIVVGVFAGAGGIGWWDDEATVLVGWPDAPPAHRGADDAGDAIEMHATARPGAVRPLEPGGVFAHRWFEIDGSTWDEFLELSTGAWPAFETAYGATIEGFFRTEAAPGGTDRVLLITRYPSYAAWEQSRGALRDPTADVAESGRRFLRRRELTKRSIVRIGVLR